MASTTIPPNLTHLKIPLEDVAEATNNFHRDNIIGHGDFGTVYKGQLLWSGNLINIVARKLDRKHRVGDVEFWNEVRLLSDLKHKYVVSIIGFCDEKHEKIIITTYEANGSLGQFLDNMNLTWTQRLRISVGVAKALSYLHYDEGRGYVVIHNFINSSTILIDENLEVKLSGFEFSIKQPVNRRDHITLCDLVGARGYMDPAIVKTGGATHRSDTYSFGVVLFEILCGRNVFIQNDGDMFLTSLVTRHHKNNTLKDIIHPDLLNQMSPKSLEKYLKVAYACLTEERARRPDTNDIVRKLEKALKNHMQFENLGKNSETLNIPLWDIKLATDNFSETYKIQDWDDCTLYRAEFDQFKKNPSYVEGKKNQGEYPKGYNTVVIIRYPRDREEDFTTNFEMLASVKHHNIISLFGFCVDGSEMILVFENAFEGFLEDYLINIKQYKDIFTWEKRLKICIDVAHALCYLHYEMEDKKMIINGDICSRNIALDEEWRAEIFDFGSAVFLPPNQEDEALYLDGSGRKSYIDPQYKKTSKLKRESDVYGFGVVLFEILCGKVAFDPIYLRESDMGLAHVARQSIRKGTLEDMIDPIIKEESGYNNLAQDRGPNKDSLRTFIEIAHQCVAETQDQRPTMKVVVEELEKALSYQKNHKEDKRVSLEDIRQATNNFHVSKCIGRGGFGKAYKGDLKDGDRFKTIVAKRLDKRSDQGGRQFLSELQILWEYKHENIIGLEGYCDENQEKIIVYEYASRGSLDRYLIDASLTWAKRLNICIDVASALDFLHGGVGKQAKVIHRDIKTENILLNDDWKAKLADFGLSLISSLTQEGDYIIDHWCGTPGYVDPVYMTSRLLTIESDIYSFGVVLFEILCGRSTYAIHKHEGHHLSEFIKKRFDEGNLDEVVFKEIREEIVPESLTTFQNIAYQCLQHERENRPTTKEVLIELKKALEFQVVLSELKKALEFQLNSEVKSDYVEKSHASIAKTQIDKLSGELMNSMTKTSESDQTKDSAESG